MSNIKGAQNTGELEGIKRDIIKARKWAKKHFNVGQKEDHVLAPPTFDIEYPEPDKIQVWPRCYGRRLAPSFTYALLWGPDTLIWRGYHPVSGARIDLVVEEKEEATGDEVAIGKVETFVRKHGHKGEVRVLQVVRRDGYIDVFLLRPYGLFIIRPDGSIEDNYKVYEL